MAKLGVGGPSPHGWFHHHWEQPLRISEQSQHSLAAVLILLKVHNLISFCLNIYLLGCAGSSLQHVGSSSLTRDGTLGPPVSGVWSLSHWTTREVPQLVSFKSVFLSLT